MECQSLREEVMALRQKVKSLSLDDSFIGFDQKVRDMTGLPNYSVLECTVKTLEPFMHYTLMLTPFQHIY